LVVFLWVCIPKYWIDNILILVILKLGHSSYERAKPLKDGGAKLQGLKPLGYASQLPNMITFRRIMKITLGGKTMLTFFAGLFIGSIIVVFMMSLMQAAKIGDRHLEM
jgi:hypothetical protein